MAAHHLPPERKGYPAPPELAARRAGLIVAMEAGMWRTDPPPDEVTIAGVRALRFNPPKESRGSVLHVHGGAFRMGSPETVAPFAAALAERCSVTVVCPAYRLAPEHPFPVGLRDTYTVMTAIGAERMILSGDSAGGGIAAGLAALAAQDNERLAGLALLSPWLDLTVSSASYMENSESDPLFSAEAAHEAAALYLQGVSPSDRVASPLFGSVEGYPPTLINVGAGEVLKDDAQRFYTKLKSAGITVQLDQVEGMEHVAVTRDHSLTGAAHTFDTLAIFVNRLLSED